MTQKTLNFNAPVQQVVSCEKYYESQADPEQSKDEIVRARVTDKQLKRIDSFCRGRRINKSEYLRHLMTLDERYFDLIEKLNDHAETFLLQLLENIPKKF